MFRKIFGEYFSAVLFLIIGIVLLYFSFINQTSLVFKMLATLFGVLLTLINAINLISMYFFEGKDESAKTPVSYLSQSKNALLNFHNWTTPFTLCGLALATGLIFMAFSWQGDNKPTFKFEPLYYLEVDEMEPPITDQKPELPPPVVQPPPPTVVVQIIPDDIITDAPEVVDVMIDLDEHTDIPDPDDVVEDIKIEIKDEEPEEVPTEPDFHLIVEEMPTFPGGEKSLFQFLSEQIRYPPIAKQNNIQGTVYLSFIINTKGEITDIEVLRDPGGGLADEAIRVVKQMPKWNPGMQQGKAVNVKFNLPVKFKLL